MDIISILGADPVFVQDDKYSDISRDSTQDPHGYLRGTAPYQLPYAPDVNISSYLLHNSQYESFVTETKYHTLVVIHTPQSQTYVRLWSRHFKTTHAVRSELCSHDPETKAWLDHYATKHGHRHTWKKIPLFRIPFLMKEPVTYDYIVTVPPSPQPRAWSAVSMIKNTMISDMMSSWCVIDDRKNLMENSKITKSAFYLANVLTILTDVIEPGMSKMLDDASVPKSNLIVMQSCNFSKLSHQELKQLLKDREKNPSQSSSSTDDHLS